MHARIETGAEAESSWLAWTNAGHPPPLLLGPDGQGRYLQDGPPDLMIGVLPDVERADQRTLVDDGSTLLLYTDGLVERRGEHLDEGLERLREAGSRHAHLPVEKFLDAVLRDLVDAGGLHLLAGSAQARGTHEPDRRLDPCGASKPPPQTVPARPRPRCATGC